MSTSTALNPAVRAAFTGLIDYAGLFPPAQLPMAQADAEYRRERAGAYAWMLGRFIIPDHALQTLPPELTGPFSVIVQLGSDFEGLHSVAERRAAGARIEALEVALPKTDDAIPIMLDFIGDVRTLEDLPIYVEIPRTPSWSELLVPTMSALRTSGFGAKIRCGGLNADAFPSVDEVASFVTAARKENVPFKATAGLHHPVRHIDRASGFTMHGFLNLLAAATLAPRVDGETLARIVAEEDPRAFVFGDESFSWRDHRVSTAQLERARREGFVAYGSCSFSEPVDDLIGLGILPAR
jgi:hypothetical protein